MSYKTLEQQIKELWASRGLEVIEETFTGIGKNRFKWTIVAKENKNLAKKAQEEAKRKFMTLRRIFILHKEEIYSDSELLHFLAGWCQFAPQGKEVKLLETLP